MVSAMLVENLLPSDGGENVDPVAAPKNLNTVTVQLEENLKQEQRFSCQMLYTVFKHCLNPVQVRLLHPWQHALAVLRPESLLFCDFSIVSDLSRVKFAMHSQAMKAPCGLQFCVHNPSCLCFHDWKAPHHTVLDLCWSHKCLCSSRGDTLDKVPRLVLGLHTSA